MKAANATGQALLGRNFRITIDGNELGFSEVIGLGSETSVTPDGCAGDSRFMRLILRRALGASRELFEWRERILRGERDLRDVLVQVLDRPGGLPAHTWRLGGAWPCRWSGPVLNALEAGVALEELEIVYASLIWLDHYERGAR